MGYATLLVKQRNDRLKCMHIIPQNVQEESQLVAYMKAHFEVLSDRLKSLTKTSMKAFIWKYTCMFALSELNIVHIILGLKV